MEDTFISFKLFLGNMSNPSINRWGLNLFWYKHWYSDKTSQVTIQQDSLLDDLIYSYLFYGLLYPKNIFINKYWYNFKYNIKLNLNKLHNEKYYRFVELKNLFSNEKSIQRLRIKIKQMYFSKIWVLRYQQWLIINFYNFQSLKKFTNTAKKSTNVTSLKYLNIKQHSNLKRIKFFLNLTLLKLNNNKKSYYF